MKVESLVSGAFKNPESLNSNLEQVEQLLLSEVTTYKTAHFKDSLPHLLLKHCLLRCSQEEISTEMSLDQLHSFMLSTVQTSLDIMHSFCALVKKTLFSDIAEQC